MIAGAAPSAFKGDDRDGDATVLVSRHFQQQ